MFFFGGLKIKAIKFLFIIGLAEIPYTYALNSIGYSLSKNIFNEKFKIIDLFGDKSFIYPFFLVLTILIVSKFIIKKR